MAYNPQTPGTPYTYVSVAGTNGVNVKAAEGNILAIQAGNTSSTPRWLKVFNLAVAPTVGTSVPVMNILIPPNSSGNNVQVSYGISFSAGISFAITAGVALLDNSACTGNEVNVDIQYQ